MWLENLFCTIKENHGLKKQINHFDDTVGSLGEAEVCERIGIFLLSLIGSKYNPNNIGLYRYDGWQFLKKQTAHNLKKSKRLFKNV